MYDTAQINGLFGLPCLPPNCNRTYLEEFYDYGQVIHITKSIIESSYSCRDSWIRQDQYLNRSLSMATTLTRARSTARHSMMVPGARSLSVTLA